MKVNILGSMQELALFVGGSKTRYVAFPEIKVRSTFVKRKMTKNGNGKNNLKIAA